LSISFAQPATTNHCKRRLIFCSIVCCLPPHLNTHTRLIRSAAAYNLSSRKNARPESRGNLLTQLLPRRRSPLRTLIRRLRPKHTIFPHKPLSLLDIESDHHNPNQLRIDGIKMYAYRIYSAIFDLDNKTRVRGCGFFVQDDEESWVEVRGWEFVDA